MKKFEVISPYLDKDNQVIESGAIIELDEVSEAVFRKAYLIGACPVETNGENKKEKKVTKRSEKQ
ncbi:hypothetical protein PDENDC454_04374 [Paenibacillus dendritiformis C454]|uniref:Uncharacterized protein n=1 Tax=Paenibacillus dendritiformis C454 TaxID=1131935 RepID=H3SBI9_9BACL|nr:hypothetical protein [Paenibacillus dendritiformis]EHQ63672.1 hypothetical protein PDENDC454_04374 [Paenibacillus dendritiformis C454]